MTHPKPKVPILFTDTETFSTTDIKKAGAVRYTEEAEMILAGFKLGEQYSVWDYNDNTSLPSFALEHIHNGGIVCAHNALFDYCVLKEHIPELSITQMIDTQAMCAAHALPLSLEKAGEVLSLHPDKQKLKDGKRLVRKFCIPRKPSKYDPSTRVCKADAPEDWEKFKGEYLRLDVEAMEEVYRLLPPLTDKEQQVWVDTQKVNLLGVPIDMKTVNLIIEKLDALIDEESSKFIRVTGLYPTQRDRILEWVAKQGVLLPNLQAATVKELLDNPDANPLVKQALAIRADVSHMSFKKYPAMATTVCQDGTVKGTLMYHIAGTGRFGGRLIQTQNLTKGNIDAEQAVEEIKAGKFSIELVKSAVRGMIHHPEGLTIVDYSGIEARVVQFVAQDEEALEVFRQGLDPYKWMAQRIYGVEYGEVTSKQRFTGKQAILGLGYQMSAKKFVSMVESYGEEISSREATLAVKTYRSTHRKLTGFWVSINRGAVMALQRPNKLIKVNKYVSFLLEGRFLYMVLPSGRRLAYYQPKLESSSWGDQTFSYLSMNEKHQYVRTHTYGGKLTENLVQAFARDLLTEAITLLLSKGYRVITHIHDEIVVLGMDSLDEITELMCIVPEWAEGLPLAAEGFTSTRFKKG